MNLYYNEPAPDAFYTEVINIAYQYRKFQNKPERKLSNVFGATITWTLICLAFIGYLTFLVITKKNDSVTNVLIGCMAVCFILFITILLGMYKNKRLSKAGFKPSTVAFDGTGIVFDKSGVQVIKLNWSEILVVRVFKNSICFIGKPGIQQVVCVRIEDKDAILQYLKENAINVNVL